MRRIVLRHKMICHFLEECNKALLKEPGNIEILRTRGIMYNLGMKYNEAINDFVKVLEANPDDVDSYYLKGDCHFQLGQFEKAKEELMRAVLLEDNPNIEREQITNVLISAAPELNEIEKILEFERNKVILKSFPDQAED